MSLGLTACVATGAFGSAGSPKWDLFLQAASQQHTPAKVSVIAKLSGPLTKRDRAAIAKLGGSVTRELSIVNSVCVTLPSKKLESLSRLSKIAHLSYDAQVKKTDSFTVNGTYANVAFQQYGATGAGVTVAVMDSGIYPDADVASRIVANVSMISGLSPVDQCGHGTHVSGILAGNGAQSTGSQFTQSYMGVARAANLVNVRVLDQTGSGSVSNVIAGIQWVVQNQPTYHIRVLNISIGHPVGEPSKSDPLCQAVEKAWKAGIAVVVAAGNDGRLDSFPLPLLPNSGYGTNYGTVECPGNDPDVITVGAMKQVDNNRNDDEVASYSSRGPSLFDFTVKPDIMAPGNLITSTLNAPTSWLAQNYESDIRVANSAYIKGGTGYSSNYAILSGTSMATPVVSGAVALMLQLQPNLTPDTVKVRLMVSADKWADLLGLGDPCTYGAGFLDIPAAINSPCNATSTAQSPGLNETLLGTVVFDLLGPLLGDGNLSLTQVYGQRAMWGTSTLASSRAMWGTSTWGDTQQKNFTILGINLSNNILLSGE